MNDEPQVEVAGEPPAAPEAVEAPAKKVKKTKETVTMVILRDYWQKGDLSEGDRVRAGTKVEVSIDAAMAGLESGAMRRATEAD